MLFLKFYSRFPDDFLKIELVNHILSRRQWVEHNIRRIREVRRVGQIPPHFLRRHLEHRLLEKVIDHTNMNSDVLLEEHVELSLVEILSVAFCFLSELVLTKEVFGCD